MEGISQTYERYHREIQLLKKQLSTEKLAHENTLKQLQNAYDILDEMRESLRMEQASNLKMKAELADKTNRIASISAQYEDQIMGIKEMIDAKDEELRRMSSVLLVSDYDMIRLKVVNELELNHREEVERLTAEIHKKSGQNAELRSKLSLTLQKYQHLTSQIKRKQQETADNLEQVHRKHLVEVKNLYQSSERNKLDSEKWKRKHENLDLRSKKQIAGLRDQLDQLNRQLNSSEARRATA